MARLAVSNLVHCHRYARNGQFEYINKKAGSFLKDGQPVISVDTKKKELVGNFKNAGREWTRKGSPEEVNVHDFIDPKLKRAVPYGVYRLGQRRNGSRHRGLCGERHPSLVEGHGKETVSETQRPLCDS